MVILKKENAERIGHKTRNVIFIQCTLCDIRIKKLFKELSVLYHGLTDR